MTGPITQGKDYNYFSRLTISSATFSNDPNCQFAFRGNPSFSLINDGAGIIEYSFNGNTVHGDLVPNTPYAAMVFNLKGVNQIWFRLKSGSASDVRVEAGIGEYCLTNGKSLTIESTLSSLVTILEGRLLTDSGVWAYLDPITTSDSVDLPNAPARGILVLTSGNITFEAMRSDGVTRYTVGPIAYTAKDVIPIAVYRVHATGTTATVAAGF